MLGLLAVLVTIWASFGSRFYAGAIPYYDSLAYQTGYRDVAAVADENGATKALRQVWQEEGNNVVLYRFFAAAVGRYVPSPITGLYIYLLGIHVLAALALTKLVRTTTGQWAPAFFAVAVAFSTTPFGIVRGGIGDQRMDLTSGSAYLLVGALGLLWLRKPGVLTAFATSLAASAACLHRPILGPSLAIVAISLFAVAAIRNRQSVRAWLTQIIAIALPLGTLAIPWFIRHREGLRYYYVEYGPALDVHVTWADAVRFNIGWFTHNIGWWSAGILFVGFGLVATRLKIRLADVGLIILMTLAPLAVLIGNKSVINAWVQQMCIGVPALLLAAFGGVRQEAPFPRWITGLSIASVGLVITLTAVKLSRDLSTEPPNAKGEVVAVLDTVASVSEGGAIAGFHDLPVSVSAMITIAQNENLPFYEGTQSFYPPDFGLSRTFDAAANPTALRDAIQARLDDIKRNNQIVLLPTLDTKYRLWQGLFSHQIIPQLHDALMADPAFQLVARAGPVQDVHFNIFIVHPRAD